MKLFVYGTLRPDHPGFCFFEDQGFSIEEPTRRAQLAGYELRNWDGLPIAIESQNPTSRVHGFLLNILDQSHSKVDIKSRLDKYELGEGEYRRKLELRHVDLTINSSVVPAQAYVLRKLKFEIESHVLDSETVDSGDWTMAQDRLMRRVFPLVAKKLDNAICGWTQMDKEQRFIELLGIFLVMYTCLERFGLFLFGPRRYKREDKDKDKDRHPLQNLLAERYFKSRQVSEETDKWFQVVLSSAIQVLDSDTMNRWVLGEDPARFWSTVRNNTAHQGKSPNPDSDLLVLVAASTLADFLAGALSAIGKGGIGAELVNGWEVVGFRHTPNQFQELVKTSLTHPF